MKILIITHYFPPMNSIASHRPYSWAKWWSKMGHIVTVLTTEKQCENTGLDLRMPNVHMVYYRTLHGRLSGLRNRVKGADTGATAYKSSSGVSVLMKALGYLHRAIGYTGALTWDARIPNLVATGMNEGYKKVSNQRWDLVVSTFAPYSCHEIAYNLKINGLADKWIADYRDLWTQTHLYTGLFPFTRYEEYLEKRINSTADIITTVSDPLAEAIRNKYNKRETYVVENGFDIDDLGRIPKEKYWHDEKIRIVYTGSIYKGYRDPSPLFAAISRLEKENFPSLGRLEVLFAGGLKADLDSLIKKYNVGAYVRHLGMLKRENALHMQRDADVLLLLEYETKKTKGILTGKLFEYLASGTLIWAVGLDRKSSIANILNESGQGVALGVSLDRISKQLRAALESDSREPKKTNQFVLHRYSREMLANKMLQLVL